MKNSPQIHKEWKRAQWKRRMQELPIPPQEAVILAVLLAACVATIHYITLGAV